MPNNQLKSSFWWDLIEEGDLAFDTLRLEEEFSADETKELKTKKKEEVQSGANSQSIKNSMC